jgi:fatty-acyl-CoA synthase
MTSFASVADRNAIEAEAPWEARRLAPSVYALLSETAARHATRPAFSFQLTSGPNDPTETLSWAEFKAQVTQAANLFRALGIGAEDVVALVLPNCSETAVALIGGAVAGIVNPINPLLDAEQIAGILRESRAKVVVTLKAFPKTDIAAKVAEAVAEVPEVRTVLEVDLNRYLTAPKKWIVPFLRPKHQVRHRAEVLDFARATAGQPDDRLSFEEAQGDRIAAYFHTGGTTGMPKLAQHRVSGMVYNGWLGERLLFKSDAVVICPLPLFHVFAVYPILFSALTGGAHLVFPTPAGYRGEGVMDNFWKLVERWRVTFVITVPTAVSALMQRPVDADVSSLQFALSGSAAMPLELFRRFETATGVAIVEGYGLTEATCLVSCNPPGGAKKIGSVGIPFPYTHVRILKCDDAGAVIKECGTDEIGEICVANPGVFPSQTYRDAAKNVGLFADGRYLRTGDLGRIDVDGYLYITGRAKDLIIRGGHNIDPAEIEEALLSHPAVAFAGAIGQPDAFAGELPCVYVELIEGADVSAEALMQHAKTHIHERAAVPKHVEVLPELPKTAVGKVFKPDLRKRAILRVYNSALAAAGVEAEVAAVIEDRKRGLIAELVRKGQASDADVAGVLDNFTRPWEWQRQG